MIKTMLLIPENMYKAAQGGFINATDLADYLTKKGMPFRSAYKIVGQIVAECIEKHTVLDKLPIDAYKAHSDIFEEDLYVEISLETCVEKRISEGGTSVASVEHQLELVRKELEA
jgi:argininosuccinate lyase